jgi:hypothetical protein
MQNYTRKEWGRYKTTLERSGKDPKLHSKGVWFVLSISIESQLGERQSLTLPSIVEGPESTESTNYTRNEWGSCKTPLETSVVLLPRRSAMTLSRISVSVEENISNTMY